MSRVNYFDMNTLRFVYGYKWKENIHTEHELNPIDVSFTTVSNQSVAFTTLLNANPFLKIIVHILCRQQSRDLGTYLRP